MPPRVGTLQAPPELLGWVPERTPWSLSGVTGALEPGPRPGGEQGLGPGTTPQRVSWAPTSLPRCARFWKSLRVRSGRWGEGGRPCAMGPVTPVVLEVDLALGALPPAVRGVSREKGPTLGRGRLQTHLQAGPWAPLTRSLRSRTSTCACPAARPRGPGVTGRGPGGRGTPEWPLSPPARPQGPRGPAPVLPPAEGARAALAVRPPRGGLLPAGRLRAAGRPGRPPPVSARRPLLPAADLLPAVGEGLSPSRGRGSTGGRSGGEGQGSRWGSGPGKVHGGGRVHWGRGRLGASTAGRSPWGAGSTGGQGVHRGGRAASTEAGVGGSRGRGARGESTGGGLGVEST